MEENIKNTRIATHENGIKITAIILNHLVVKKLDKSEMISVLADSIILDLAMENKRTQSFEDPKGFTEVKIDKEVSNFDVNTNERANDAESVISITMETLNNMGIESKTTSPFIVSTLIRTLVLEEKTSFEHNWIGVGCLTIKDITSFKAEFLASWDINQQTCH